MAKLEVFLVAQVVVHNPSAYCSARKSIYDPSRRWRFLYSGVEIASILISLQAILSDKKEQETKRWLLLNFTLCPGFPSVAAPRASFSLTWMKTKSRISRGETSGIGFFTIKLFTTTSSIKCARMEDAKTDSTMIKVFLFSSTAKHQASMN